MPPEAAAEERRRLPPHREPDQGLRLPPFLRPGVPEALRNAGAAQALWRSDPVFANLDGLVEYGEDFGAPFRAAGVVATVYRVLEGMPEREGGAAPGRKPGNGRRSERRDAGHGSRPPEKGAPPEPAEAGRAPATAPSRRRADEVELD